jgi:intracellular multiplication protein IcmO
VADFAMPIVGEEDLKWFTNPLLLRGRTREALIQIERLSGQSEADATKIADNIVNDVIKATYYPPKEVLTRDVEGVHDAVEQLYTQLTGQQGGEVKEIEAQKT